MSRAPNLSPSLLVTLLLAPDVSPPAALAATPPAYEFIREMRPELAASREARHRKIAERRAGPILIVHRGANAFATENTLEAYAAAMDYGADGCEVDLRRTRDGVLVLFHDDMLDRLTEAYGEINELTYHQLMGVPRRLDYGRALPCTGPPTLAALLEVARQRAMLLHLDVKELGLDNDITHLLDAADMWDHIVAVNTSNATNLLKNPKLRLLQYKMSFYDGRRDVDPAFVSTHLPAPGQMVIVDDPRLSAQALKRPAYQPVALPSGLCVPLRAAGPLLVWNSTNFNVYEFTQGLGTITQERMWTVLAADFPEANRVDGDAAFQRWRTERILERAWAARAVVPAWKSARLVTLLEQQVRHRSLHGHWRFHGLDGAAAIRALARLRATESVPVLLAAFRRVDANLREITDPLVAEYPLAWRDVRFKMEILPALGELRCAASKQFLLEYLAMDEAAAREWAPVDWEGATKSLLRQRLSLDELKSLLRHHQAAVRGTAVLEFLDHPTRARSRALRETAPWALEVIQTKR